MNSNITRVLRPYYVNRNSLSLFMLNQRFFSLSLLSSERNKIEVETDETRSDMTVEGSNETTKESVDSLVCDRNQIKYLQEEVSRLANNKKDSINKFDDEKLVSLEENTLNIRKKKNWKKKRRKKTKFNFTASVKPEDMNPEKSSQTQQFKKLDKQKNDTVSRLISLIDTNGNDDRKELNTEERLKCLFGDLSTYYDNSKKKLWIDLELGLSTDLFTNSNNSSRSCIGNNINSNISKHSQTLHERHWLQDLSHIISPERSRNRFEVMMLDIDKEWKFPINNEQGVEVEEETSFMEHVFLDHYLNDFPNTEPIQTYMQLVIVGLQQNPYLSAQEKKEKILWHKDYFERFPAEDLSFPTQI